MKRIKYKESYNEKDVFFMSTEDIQEYRVRAKTITGRLFYYTPNGIIAKVKRFFGKEVKQEIGYNIEPPLSHFDYLFEDKNYISSWATHSRIKEMYTWLEISLQDKAGEYDKRYEWDR